MKLGHDKCGSLLELCSDFRLVDYVVVHVPIGQCFFMFHVLFGVFISFFVFCKVVNRHLR
jgi:hypothetical protein